jgi:hypothetical protein
MQAVLQLIGFAMLVAVAAFMLREDRPHPCVQAKQGPTVHAFNCR